MNTYNVRHYHIDNTDADWIEVQATTLAHAANTYVVSNAMKWQTTTGKVLVEVQGDQPNAAIAKYEVKYNLQIEARLV